MYLLKVTTENAWYYINVDNTDEDNVIYRIQAHNLHYLAEKILLKRVEKPKLELPLVIWFNETDKLVTTRVKRMEYASGLKEESVKTPPPINSTV